MRAATALVAVLSCGLLAACSGGTPRDGGSPATQSGTASDSQSPSESNPTSTPSGGTADQPAKVTPQDDPLRWKKAPGAVTDTITVGDHGTLTVTADASRATLAGDQSATVDADAGFRVTDALMNDSYAVVVTGDRQEQKPARATVVDLASGNQFVVDGDSEAATVNGGSWALGNGQLEHPTLGPKRAYCLATVDLATQSSDVGWCAPARTGFTHVQVGPGGVSLMAFDDARPSCRTVAEVTDGELTPFPGVTECTGWEGVALDGGRVWSVIPNERRIERAHFYASVGDGYFDLGMGDSGTLTTCDGAAYFNRAPERDRDPAQVLRWTTDGRLSVVYATETGGEAFVSGTARCGGHHLTVTALTSKGDSQVTAATS
ncbi:MAG: hypothetical protein QM714_11315 [Nocardioides sp.]|uniref:hypothetical protein n=1 Tax=Nocardioides sp. TaxID=35761 RepID=UPI0039E508B2